LQFARIYQLESITCSAFTRRSLGDIVLFPTRPPHLLQLLQHQFLRRRCRCLHQHRLCPPIRRDVAATCNSAALFFLREKCHWRDCSDTSLRDATQRCGVGQPMPVMSAWSGTSRHGMVNCAVHPSSPPRARGIQLQLCRVRHTVHPRRDSSTPLLCSPLFCSSLLTFNVG